MPRIKVKISRQENAQYFNVQIGDVVEIDVESYVFGVVASQIGNAQIQCAKAQAVAARTYCWKNVTTNKPISDSSSSAQAFRAKKMDKNQYSNAYEGTLQTKGQLLYYNGILINSCPYSRSNGGQTVSSQQRWGGQRDWLVKKEDPYDLIKSCGKKTGHGVGMSQFGAMAMADLGFSYLQILQFYYPGTYIHQEEQPLTSKELTIINWCQSQVGNGYVWGGTGQVLTQKQLQQLKRQYPDHVTDAARKWLGKRVYDCATFARNAMKQVGISLVSGASSQWKKTDWAEKGTINNLPIDKVCLVYRQSPSANPMQHVGVYCGNNIFIDARGTSSGVVKNQLGSYPWTHYAIPKGLYNEDQEVIPVLYQATVVAQSGNTVRMRQSPSTSSSILANVPVGTLVDVIEETNNDWYKIVYNNKTGYMMTDFLENAGSSEGQYYIRVNCQNESEAKQLVEAIKKFSSAFVEKD